MEETKDAEKQEEEKQEEKLVEEEVQIVEEVAGKEKVKDIGFALNTSTSGEASYTTEQINGILEGIVISSPQPIRLKITLDNYEEVVLFDTNYGTVSGDEYLPLCLGAMSNTGENFREPVKWALNDKLKFSIKGPFNVTIKITVRYIE